MGFFNKYKGSYGKLLFDFNYTNPVFYLEEDGEYSYIYFDRNKTDTGGTFRKKKGEYMQGAPSPNIKSGYKFEEDGSAAYAIRFASYDAYKTIGSDNTYIRDFFVGNNQDLVFNLKDYFGAVDINDEIAGKDASSNPDNWTAANCQAGDIGCHISNLGGSITNSITGFFGKINDGIKVIGNWIIENLKSLFEWIIEKLKAFFTPIYEKFEGIFKPIWDYIYSWYKPLWLLIIGEKTIEDFVWGDQEYICSKNPTLFIEETTSSAFKPAETLGSILYFISPLPPPEGSKICTSFGLKTIHYNKSTFWDIIVFNIFVFAGLWFMFLFVKPR